MTDLDIFRTRIITWIEQNSARPVWWENQNFPSTTAPFLTVFISTIENEGLAETTNIDEFGNRLVLLNRRVTLSLTGFGDGSVAEVMRLHDTLYFRSIIDEFNNDGVSFISLIAMNDNTRLLESTMQEQAVADLVFTFRPEYSENVSYIETVEAEGEFYNSDNDLVTTRTINAGA
jgi:hypothetical protein